MRVGRADCMLAEKKASSDWNNAFKHHVIVDVACAMSWNLRKIGMLLVPYTVVMLLVVGEGSFVRMRLMNGEYRSISRRRDAR